MSVTLCECWAYPRVTHIDLHSIEVAETLTLFYPCFTPEAFAERQQSARVNAVTHGH